MLGAANALERTHLAAKQVTLRYVPFDTLIGSTSDIGARFTCSLAAGKALGNLTARRPVASPTVLETRWRLKTQPLSSSTTSTTLGDAAVGIMTSQWPWGSELPAGQSEWLLHTAYRTWMQNAMAADLELLMLADCAGSPGTVSSNHTRGEEETTAIDEFPLWLGMRDAAVKLHARCYWGVPGLVTHSKLAVLLRALYLHLPPKRWYMKVDMDTLIMPINLRRFLESMGALVPESAPVYFGSLYSRLHRSGLSRVVMKQPVNRFQLGPACRQNRTTLRNTSHLGSCFLGSSAWLALEAAQNLTAAEAKAALATTYIPYAQGGAYGVSRAALLLAIKDDCVSVVGDAAKAHWSWVPEDLILGLCMHLNQVRLLECQAFHGDPPCDLAGLYLKKGIFGCADNSSHASLARYPVSVHKLKTNATMLGWWERLRARDEWWLGGELAAWRGLDHW